MASINSTILIGEFAYCMNLVVAREIARTAQTNPAQAKAMMEGRMNDQTIPDDVKAEFRRMIVNAVMSLRD